MPFDSFHLTYMLPLMLLALLFFGPKRLPEMGSSIGKTIREFQRSMRDVSAPPASRAPAALPPALDTDPQGE